MKLILKQDFVSQSEQDSKGESANVVDGLFAVARGLESVAKAIEALGLNRATTPMGAIELLSKEVHDGIERIANLMEPE